MKENNYTVCWEMLESFLLLLNVEAEMLNCMECNYIERITREPLARAGILLTKKSR